MKHELTEHDVQLFFDAAGKLLEAAKDDGLKSKLATQALMQFCHQLDGRLRSLEKDVVGIIEASAEMTASRAADLLREHFQQADAAAEQAAARYRHAADRLGVRMWAIFLGTQIALAGVLIVLVLVLVPSLDEILQRRADLAHINEQLDGVPLSWSICGEGRQARKCFQTDERSPRSLYRSEDGRTWRIPMRDRTPPGPQSK
ncbi:hypothetical protein [Coralloluteibacterium thermophilus]|uniref:Uncharacterized protein n=1 Tax=Coralloluteibacterium thermophilum TaxID=2707049 RepID=A0ABV9NPN6_9GAMM